MPITGADGSGRRRDCPPPCAARVERSNRALDEIGYINYHGTSTQLNDAIESQCTRRVFGALAERLPGSSTKSMIGHPQGASGAAGIVTTALALSRGFLPPTANLTDQDPACDMDYLPREGREARPQPRSATAWGSGRRTARWYRTRCRDRLRVLIVGAGTGRKPRGASARARWRRRHNPRPGLFPRNKLCGDSLNPGAMACWRDTGSPARARARVAGRGHAGHGPLGAAVRARYPGGVLGCSIPTRPRLAAAGRGRSRPAAESSRACEWSARS